METAPPGSDPAVASASGSNSPGSVDPAVNLPATLLPVAHLLVRGELDAGEPLGAFIAVHMRHDQSQRKTVAGRERLLVHLVREQHVRKGGLRSRKAVDVNAIKRVEGNEVDL